MMLKNEITDDWIVDDFTAISKELKAIENIYQ